MKKRPDAAARNAAADNSANDLIYLLSCVLNKEKPDAKRCAAMELGKLYRLSQFHMLTAAAAHALEQVAELPRPFDQAKKKAIRKIALFDIERGIILREFDKEGIRYVPLKGIIMKSLYPQSYLREMTDNDILCDGEKMHLVNCIMKRLGYECDKFGESNHDIYSKPPTLEFEMHRSLFSDRDCPELARYYQQLEGSMLETGKMSDENFYVYLTAHIFNHYRKGGIGLRALADIYVFNRRFRERLNREYLETELKKLELTDFERSFRTLAQKTFTAQPLTENESAELRYLIASGSGGITGHDEYHRTEKLLGSDDSTAAKRSYLLGRVFISGENLKESYPFVYHHKALYPALLIYRPIKGLLTHPKGILSDYKKVKAFRIDDDAAFNYKSTQRDKTDKDGKKS